MNMPVFEQIIATAPDAARELFSAYRENRDANERVKLKVKIKVLLDILSLDTILPKLPEPVVRPRNFLGDGPVGVNNGIAIGNAQLAQAPRLGDPQHREEQMMEEPAHANGNHQG